MAFLFSLSVVHAQQWPHHDTGLHRQRTPPEQWTPPGEANGRAYSVRFSPLYMAADFDEVSDWCVHSNIHYAYTVYQVLFFQLNDMTDKQRFSISNSGTVNHAFRQTISSISWTGLRIFWVRNKIFFYFTILFSAH